MEQYDYSFLNNLSVPENYEEGIQTGTLRTEHGHVITPEEVYDALGTGCAMCIVSVGEGDTQKIYLTNPKVGFENFWGEVFRISLEGEAGDEIVKKLSRWQQEVNAGGKIDAVFRFYPKDIQGEYGMFAADPIDWYFRSEQYGRKASVLQVLFGSNMVMIGDISAGGVERDKAVSITHD